MKKDILILPEASIKEALKKLNETSEKTLIVVDKNKKLLGTLTDGDIRRYILEKGQISGFVKDIYNRNPIFLKKRSYSLKDIKRIFLSKKIEVIPIVNEENKVIDYLSWDEVFSEEEKLKLSNQNKIDIPVVIMAGGKGTRLSPVTQIIPKPLIPVGNKTMVEHIIENFKNFGIRKFFLTLNYKGKMIESYFESIEKDYEIDFIWEKEYLGTAGSLKLLENKIEGDFIVSNCDVLLNVNYAKAFDFHKKNESVFTSITSIQHYKIPYGVVEITNGGEIKEINEKPEYTFQINTGVYILNDKVLKYIQKNKYLDMPELINKLLKNKEKVMAYPISEKDYVDMGQWDEYKEALKKIAGN